jgi:hypothetical protein
MEREILPCKSSGADGRMMSDRSQTSALLRPLRSSLSSCLKILTNREEKKQPENDDGDGVGYSQPEFSGRRCQKEGLESRFTKAFTGSLSSCLKILMTRVLVEEYYKSCTRLMTMTLSSLKQCSCGRNEDDGRQFTRQSQINVYYSTAVSYIRTRVRTSSANNTFYGSVGSETGLKKRILFCPNICGLENKRSQSTR